MPDDTFEIDPVKSHGLGRLVNRSALQEGEIFIPVDVTGEDWISLNRKVSTEGSQRHFQALTSACARPDRCIC